MPKEPPPSSRTKVTRDGAILAFALAWGTAEILWLGARPSALTFISGLLLAPVAIRFDESRRSRR